MARDRLAQEGTICRSANSIVATQLRPSGSLARPSNEEIDLSHCFDW